MARSPIGDYCFLAHEVVVADSFAARPSRAGDAGSATKEVPRCVPSGNDVRIGAGAVVLAGARIGDGAIVGAGTVVTGDIPPYAIVAGNPAEIVGWATDPPAP
jgi:acetyltransferase-like isoleucine patch superfamily enzyme